MKPTLGVLVVVLLMLVSVFSSIAESKCSKGCSLALASYYVWEGSNLTFIAEVLQSDAEVIVSYKKQTIPNKDTVREGIRANVPFPCDCIRGEFLGHEFNYTVNKGDTYTKVAQDYHANLTTYQFLQQTNSQYPTNNIPVGATLKVTVNCSCGNRLVSNDYGLFITYPLRSEDTVESIANATRLDVTLLESYNPGVNFNQGSGLVYIPGKAAKRPSLSKFHRDRVHRARLHTDRSFHSLVTLRRLAKWGLGPEPSDEAIAHEVTVRKRMSTMKENRGKEIAGEGKRPEGQTQDRPEGQTRPTAGDKRKFLPKNIDLEGLPSRRDKRIKQSSSKVIKSKPPQSQPAVQVVDVDSSTPVASTPSKTPPRTPLTKSTMPSSSQFSTNIIENEDLAWERFQIAVKDEDINTCYNMGLKEFEHSGVHDLFKAMSKFIAASRQATELDKTRVLLETRIQQVNADCKKWAGAAEKAKDEVKEHNKLIEELRTDALGKETRIDQLQKTNDELNARLSKAKEDAVAEFKSSKEYTDTLDRNYAAGFEDFRMDAVENFPEVDFSVIKLNLAAATSSLLQTGSDDVNVEDDASTQPQDEPAVDAPPS